MTGEVLDPVIHPQARLQLVASLAKLPDGEPLSFTRMQDMLALTPGNLITHLRKLKDAGYIRTEKTGSGAASCTAVTLTPRGRAALDAYTDTVRDLLGGRLTPGFDSNDDASAADGRGVEPTKAERSNGCF